MDRLTRLGRLRQLVAEAGGQVDGLKKLHKLAYLGQRAGTDLGQSFLFHMYGIYSPSLPPDLQAANAWNLVVENVAQGGGYVVVLGSEELEQGDATPPSDERGFSIVRHLAGEPPGVLEVLTTIVYLWDSGYRHEGLAKKLQELKGHLSFHFERAVELAKQYFGMEIATSRLEMVDDSDAPGPSGRWQLWRQ